MTVRTDILSGLYQDRLVKPDGRTFDYGWRSNLIVDRCRHLLAAFMKGDDAAGLQYLALGRGEATWDTTPPAPPGAGIQQLVDPSPVTIASGDMMLAYLDAAGNEAVAPTHHLQVSVTLEPGALPIEEGATSFPLREFGLFGRFSAGSQTEDYMIDYVRHGVIPVGADDTFERKIRLVF